MRFRIREAVIDPDLRRTFEQYGVISMQTNLAVENYFRMGEQTVMVKDVLNSLLPWLTEQFDRAERKETWSLLMEIAIVILVAAELSFSIYAFVEERNRVPPSTPHAANSFGCSNLSVAPARWYS